MSMFYYNSGAVDQIGGRIILPDSVVHLPFFQGLTFILPAGLSVSSNRKFIWTLEQNYPGVTLSNEEQEQPTLTFEIPPFNEVFIVIRCTIQGQPLNFARYILNTNLNDTIQNTGLGFISITSVTGVSVEQANVALDSSYISEVGQLGSLTSNLSLNWVTPSNNFAIRNYLIEEFDTSWQTIATTKNTSYTVPSVERTYGITAQRLDFFRSRRFVIKTDPNYLYAKSIAKIDNNAISTKGTVIAPQQGPGPFFTFNTTLNYEDSINLDNRAISTLSSNALSNVPSNFFTELITLDEEDSIKLDYFIVSKTNIINIVDNQPSFWTENIGI